MMIEKDHSWQTHLQTRPQSGLAERLVADERTPCQCSADKRHDYDASCCTYLPARYFSAELHKAQMTTAQAARRSCRH